MKNPEIIQRRVRSVEVQSREGSDRSGSSSALSSPLFLFSLLQLGESHIEGQYLQCVYERMKLWCVDVSLGQGLGGPFIGVGGVGATPG